MKSITLSDAPEIWAEIQKAQHILMHAHPTPDGDSLGSTLGLKHVLEAQGKKVTLIKGDSPLPQYLSFLPGYETIVQKNYFEIDLADYDLFLILDAAAPHQISRIKPVEFPSTLKTIVIDHHASNDGFGDLNFVDAAYPATAQMVFDLIKAWNLPLSHDPALCLFIGMYTDTGGFQWFTDRSVAPKTYHIAAELVSVAPDFADAIFHLHNSNTAGKLRFEGLMLESIETFFNESVAIASASQDDLQAHHIKPEDTESGSISNAIKSVVGWNIGVTMVELEPNLVKISFRTRDSKVYDLSKVAVELGGGGHKGAAGATLKFSLSESKEKVKKALQKCYGLNGN